MTPDVSTDAWALVLPSSRATALAPLRLAQGVEVAAAGESLWVRGRSRPADLNPLLVGLPADRRYAWLADDSLRPLDSRLVTERLPSLTWEPLRDWLQVSLPPAARAGRPVPKTALRLAPAEQPDEANALLLTATAWSRWADEAPQVRLDRLRFAADTSGQVLVLGTPLPSLPGRRMINREGVVVPLGRAWLPAVSPAVVRQACGAGPGAIVLWEETGAQVLGAELFVPASRAGARATAAAQGETS